MQPSPEFAAWRGQARQLLRAGIAPEHAHWDNPAQGSLLAGHDATAVEPLPAREHSAADALSYRIPARLLDLLETSDCHRDPDRHALMYRVLWRVTRGEHALLDVAADDDVRRLGQMRMSVDRDCHKMHAFVRFREVVGSNPAHFVAWYEPEHHILRRAAPFFAQRFGTMRWTIVTPDGAVHWDRTSLRFEADPALPLPASDAKETLWLTYYESIFNPARLNVRAMQREMPQKYWAHLPEAARIPALIASAPQRAGKMVEAAAENLLPRDAMPRKTPPSAPPETDMPPPDKAHIDACRRCDLWERATQGVSGEGPAGARLMLVGEQPGDEEDLQGKPFVGPAGKLLRRALEEAGVPEDGFYLTNAVKHFSWEPRGKRRIHKTPAQRQIIACRAWLEAEIARIKPAVIVALGATALNGVTGQRLKVGESRAATLRHPAGAVIIASYHPSAVLRAPEPEAKAALWESLVADLMRARKLAKS